MRKLRFLALLLALLLLPAIPARAAGTPQKMTLAGLLPTEDGGFLACDTWNKVVWELDGDGAAARIDAGKIPLSGPDGEPSGLLLDGPVKSARFVRPWGIAPFLDGYAVSDPGADAVRYVAGGKVYTLAGLKMAGSVNGSAGRAAFRGPTGLASDENGTLYVADTGNGTIRRISKDGEVSNWATGLSEPMGICWYDGKLYVAESGRNRIIRLTSGLPEVVTGVAEPAEELGVYYGGYADGPAREARFDHPQGIAVGPDGTLYIADTLNHAVRALQDGRVYTLARGGDTISIPTSPCGLAVVDDRLFVTDNFASGVLSIPLESFSFTDVSAGDWFYANVLEAGRRGLVNGTGGGAFSPYAPVTRAMFVTMLSRLHTASGGTDRIDGESGFPDLPAGGWYGPAGRWAGDKGIVRGIDGLFRPEDPISREQIAVMLYRYAEASALPLGPGGDTEGFHDRERISPWAAAALAWAVGAGILRGAEGKLRPGENASRAEVAAMLIRFMELYAM